MSRRISSNAAPRASTSASDRWAYSWTSLMAMAGLLGKLWGSRELRSDVEHAVADGGADAGLHLDVAGGLAGAGQLVAGPQVADGAGDQRDDAGVADAHPATGGHDVAGRFAGFEQGG